MERRYWLHYELLWFKRHGGLAANYPNCVFNFGDNPEQLPSQCVTAGFVVIVGRVFEIVVCV